MKNKAAAAGALLALMLFVGSVSADWYSETAGSYNTANAGGFLSSLSASGAVFRTCGLDSPNYGVTDCNPCQEAEYKDTCFDVQSDADGRVVGCDYATKNYKCGKSCACVSTLKDQEGLLAFVAGKSNCIKPGYACGTTFPCCGAGAAYNDYTGKCVNKICTDGVNAAPMTTLPSTKPTPSPTNPTASCGAYAAGAQICSGRDAMECQAGTFKFVQKCTDFCRTSGTVASCIGGTVAAPVVTPVGNCVPSATNTYTIQNVVASPAQCCTKHGDLITASAAIGVPAYVCSDAPPSTTKPTLPPTSPSQDPTYCQKKLDNRELVCLSGRAMYNQQKQGCVCVPAANEAKDDPRCHGTAGFICDTTKETLGGSLNTYTSYSLYCINNNGLKVASETYCGIDFFTPTLAPPDTGLISTVFKDVAGVVYSAASVPAILYSGEAGECLMGKCVSDKNIDARLTGDYYTETLAPAKFTRAVIAKEGKQIGVKFSTGDKIYVQGDIDIASPGWALVAADLVRTGDVLSVVGTKTITDNICGGGNEPDYASQMVFFEKAGTYTVNFELSTNVPGTYSAYVAVTTDCAGAKDRKVQSIPAANTITVYQGATTTTLKGQAAVVPEDAKAEAAEKCVSGWKKFCIDDENYFTCKTNKSTVCGSKLVSGEKYQYSCVEDATGKTANCVMPKELEDLVDNVPETNTTKKPDTTPELECDPKVVGGAGDCHDFGGTRCASITTMETCYTDSRGCAAWKASACQDGSVCVSGSCQVRQIPDDTSKTDTQRIIDQVNKTDTNYVPSPITKSLNTYWWVVLLVLGAGAIGFVALLIATGVIKRKSVPRQIPARFIPRRRY